MGYGLQLQKSFFPLINEPPINCQMILIKAKELFNYIKIKLNWMLSNHSTALFEWFTQHGLFCCHNILNSAYNYISVSCHPARKRYWRDVDDLAAVTESSWNIWSHSAHVFNTVKFSPGIHIRDYIKKVCHSVLSVSALYENILRKLCYSV